MDKLLIAKSEPLWNTDKRIISLFAGSRNSETNVLLPILCNFIKLMNKNFNDYDFIFHATDENKEQITSKLQDIQPSIIMTTPNK